MTQRRAGAGLARLHRAGGGRGPGRDARPPTCGGSARRCSPPSRAGRPTTCTATRCARSPRWSTATCPACRSGPGRRRDRRADGQGPGRPDAAGRGPRAAAPAARRPDDPIFPGLAGRADRDRHGPAERRAAELGVRALPRAGDPVAAPRTRRPRDPRRAGRERTEPRLVVAAARHRSRPDPGPLPGGFPGPAAAPPEQGPRGTGHYPAPPPPVRAAARPAGRAEPAAAAPPTAARPARRASRW